jgi:hypothetical protein
LGLIDTRISEFATIMLDDTEIVDFVMQVGNVFGRKTVVIEFEQEICST